MAHSLFQPEIFKKKLSSHYFETKQVLKKFIRVYRISLKIKKKIVFSHKFISNFGAKRPPKPNLEQDIK